MSKQIGTKNYQYAGQTSTVRNYLSVRTVLQNEGLSMTKNVFRAAPILLALVSISSSFAADNNQTLIVDKKLQIPGAVLKPGSYKLSIEDRLQDRAIVRISAIASDKHYLLLTVPNSAIGDTAADGMVYFESNRESAVRAWKCVNCPAPLEFVYPKAEAVKLTDKTAQPVMAVDPTYDKLPANLSADDMKVVTLWLLSPERITASNTGVGVKAAKYVAPESTRHLNSPTVANNGAALMAGNNVPRRHLPRTAGSNYEWMLGGLLALAAGAFLRARRVAYEKLSSNASIH